MALDDLLRQFLTDSSHELAEAPRRAANRLCDRLGEYAELSSSQISALAEPVRDGSVSLWVRSGRVPPTAIDGGFDIATVDRWARAAWAAAVGDAVGTPARTAGAASPGPFAPPVAARSDRSITRSAGAPDGLRPLGPPRRGPLGAAVFAATASGEVVRLLTVETTMPEPTADAVAARLPAVPRGAMPVDWVERSDTWVQFGCRGGSGDTLAGHLDAHGALEVAAALPLLRFVGATLDQCHRRGIRHGSLSPNAVVLDRAGAPLLADVGLAELVGRRVDEADDARDFAALAHAAFTGRPPGDGAEGLVSAGEGADVSPALRTVLAAQPRTAMCIEDLLAGRERRLAPLLAALAHEHSDATLVGGAWSPPTVDPAGPPAGSAPAALAPPDTLPSPAVPLAPPMTATVTNATAPAAATATAAATVAAATVTATTPAAPPPTITAGAEPAAAAPGGRRTTATIVAVALAVLLVVAGLAWAVAARGDDEEAAVAAPSTSATDDTSPTTVPETTASVTTVAASTTASPTTTAPPPLQVAFEPLAVADGVSGTRTWSVVDATLVSSTTITNGRAEAVALVYDEVIPPEMSADLSQVVFEPAYTEAVGPRPVARYTATVEPGASFTVTYRMPAPTGLDQAALDGWATAWRSAYAAHLADPAISPVDTDLDGFTDVNDVCDTEPGTYGGCLDADADTFPDSIGDFCPTEPGPTGGCPDADLDGVVDLNDRCPSTPGRPGATEGCPDRDGDGVRDDADRCVDTNGPASNNGCPAPAAAPRASISGPSAVGTVGCYSFSAQVSGGTATSYSWSGGQGALLSSTTGSSITACWESRGVSYSSSLSVRVTTSAGGSVSASLPIAVD